MCYTFCMAGSYQLELLKKTERTHEITSFYFKRPSEFVYKPGQYVKVTVTLEKDDSKGGTRFFTLSSSPTENQLMITTKMQSSQFKQQLYGLKVGEYLNIRGPYGDFILHEDDKRCQVFIAGGMGITPFRSMIRYAIDRTLDIPMHLMYSYNNYAVFLDELREFDRVHSPLHLNLKDSSKSGHMDQHFIESSLENLLNSVYYITGPTEMVDEVSEILEVLRVPQENIHKEYFSGYIYE